MIFFKSKKKKARENAQEWYRLARKILDYRRDVLTPAKAAELELAVDDLKNLCRDKEASVEALSQAGEPYEKLLKETGGSFYPKTFWAENSELLLVGAIIAIGFRSFFLQPFKIPTNSMYPSFNGMTAKVYLEDRPNPAARLFRVFQLGSRHYNLVSPVDGQLGFSTGRTIVPGRKWFVLPAKKIRYTFYVGAEAMTVDLPLEFDIRQVIEPLFGESGQPQGVRIGPDGERILMTGRRVRAGQSAVAFDLLTGDQLFVDRMSYHFRPPKVGEPIVFKTDTLEHIDTDNRGKYYIKRAVGGPGDIVEIQPPDLLLNGEPITGAKAFESNRNLEPGFGGYTIIGPSGLYPRPIAPGTEPIEVPEEHFFAMGDNSANSADGRMWGFVPERAIVGRAVFIYFPFSYRWGPSN